MFDRIFLSSLYFLRNQTSIFFLSFPQQLPSQKKPKEKRGKINSIFPVTKQTPLLPTLQQPKKNMKNARTQRNSHLRICKKRTWKRSVG